MKRRGGKKSWIIALIAAAGATFHPGPSTASEPIPHPLSQMIEKSRTDSATPNRGAHQEFKEILSILYEIKAVLADAKKIALEMERGKITNAKTRILIPFLEKIVILSNALKKYEGVSFEFLFGYGNDLPTIKRFASLGIPSKGALSQVLRALQELANKLKAVQHTLDNQSPTGKFSISKL